MSRWSRTFVRSASWLTTCVWCRKRRWSTLSARFYTKSISLQNPQARQRPQHIFKTQWGMQVETLCYWSPARTSGTSFFDKPQPHVVPKFNRHIRDGTWGEEKKIALAYIVSSYKF